MIDLDRFCRENQDIVLIKMGSIMRGSKIYSSKKLTELTPMIYNSTTPINTHNLLPNDVEFFYVSNDGNDILNIFFRDDRRVYAISVQKSPKLDKQIIQLYPMTTDVTKNVHLSKLFTLAEEFLMKNSSCDFRYISHNRNVYIFSLTDCVLSRSRREIIVPQLLRPSRTGMLFTPFCVFSPKSPYKYVQSKTMIHREKSILMVSTSVWSEHGLVDTIYVSQEFSYDNKTAELSIKNIRISSLFPGGEYITMDGIIEELILHYIMLNKMYINGEDISIKDIIYQGMNSSFADYYAIENKNHSCADVSCLAIRSEVIAIKRAEAFLSISHSYIDEIIRNKFIQ